MENVFREAVRELSEDRPVVIASVVKTAGSTPQKPGAKLLVRFDGSGVGTLGGGCVEGDIWFAAKTLLREGGTAVMHDYILNEDLAAQDGLVCGGTMYFLIDPIYAPGEYLPFAQAVADAYKGGPPVAIANLMVPPTESTLKVGAKMLIRENGGTDRSLGSDALDQEAVGNARRLLAMGKTDYIISPTGAEYFLEAYTTPPTLVIAGGGHVGKALAPIAKSVGMRLFVIDDRPEFANVERFPEADIVKPADFVSSLQELPINANTFIVIATRGHRYDDVALEAAARTPASYVALLGSRRKTILIYEALLERDLPMDRIREIRSPSGLDIGARTPEEIAISIMAEILMFRLGGGGGPMKLDEKYLKRIEDKYRSRSGVGATD